MEWLGQFHPQLVHFPIALIVVALLFDVVGRLTGLDWWKRGASILLLLGVLGAWGAVISGQQMGDRLEHAGVPEQAVDDHEDAAKIAAWLATGALAARLGSGALKGGAATGVGALGLLLHLFAVSALGVAGHRGGVLVYQHMAKPELRGATIGTTGPMSRSVDEERGEGGEREGGERR